MKAFKIGILRETRRWKDRRAAITPESAKQILEKWNQVEIVVQPSEIRIFKDDEYKKVGVKIREDLSDCDLLIGVKEVAEEALIEGKMYFMFAHVAKKQKHNQSFFKEMAKKRITLLDYEYFTDENNSRLVAFGHWAGVVGAYYAIMGMMKRYLNTDIPHPSNFYDVDELFKFLKTFKIPPLKIVITGDGRVGQGAALTLRAHGVREMKKDEFLKENFKEAVYCMLPFEDYVKPKANSKVKMEDFFDAPEDFESAFKPFTNITDVYIPCHFWNPKSPVFFSLDDIQADDFRIKIISDVSCDVPGPVPTTIRTSEHESSFYDINPQTLAEEPPYSGINNILVTAVDNLPTALPINASNTFADALLEHVIPAFFDQDSKGILNRATILKNGQLTEQYAYLEDFLNS